MPISMSGGAKCGKSVNCLQYTVYIVRMPFEEKKYCSLQMENCCGTQTRNFAQVSFPAVTVCNLNRVHCGNIAATIRYSHRLTGFTVAT